jgi:hypothetical protein
VEVKNRRLAGPSDNGLVERAYIDTLIQRVMGAAAKIHKHAKSFKKVVNQYYGWTTECQGDTSFCHILGLFLPASSVKTATEPFCTLQNESLSSAVSTRATSVLATPQPQTPTDTWVYSRLQIMRPARSFATAVKNSFATSFKNLNGIRVLVAR